MKTHNYPLWEKTLSELLRPMDIDYLRANAKSFANGEISTILLMGNGHGKTVIERTLLAALGFEKGGDSMIISDTCWYGAYMLIGKESCPTIFFNNKIKEENMIQDLIARLVIELPEIRKWALA